VAQGMFCNNFYSDNNTERLIIMIRSLKT